MLTEPAVQKVSAVLKEHLVDFSQFFLVVSLGRGELLTFPYQVDISHDDETIIDSTVSFDQPWPVSDRATINPYVVENQHLNDMCPATLITAEAVDLETHHHPQHSRPRISTQATSIPTPMSTPSTQKLSDHRRSPYSLRKLSQRPVNRKDPSAKPNLANLADELVKTMVPGHAYTDQKKPIWWPVTLEHKRPSRLKKDRKPDFKIIAFRLSTDTAAEIVDLLRVIRVELQARPVQGLDSDCLDVLDSIKLPMGGSGRLATKELSTRLCFTQDQSAHGPTQVSIASASGMVDPPLYGSASGYEEWRSRCFDQSTPMFPPLPAPTMATFDSRASAEAQMFGDGQSCMICQSSCASESHTV